MRLGRGPGPPHRSGRLEDGAGLRSTGQLISSCSAGEVPVPVPSLVQGRAGQAHWGTGNLCPSPQAARQAPPAGPGVGLGQRVEPLQWQLNLPFPDATANQLCETRTTKSRSPVRAAGGKHSSGRMQAPQKRLRARRQELLGSQAEAQSGKLREKSHLKPTTQIFHKNPPAPSLFVKKRIHTAFLLVTWPRIICGRKV